MALSPVIQQALPTATAVFVTPFCEPSNSERLVASILRQTSPVQMLYAPSTMLASLDTSAIPPVKPYDEALAKSNPKEILCNMESERVLFCDASCYLSDNAIEEASSNQSSECTVIPTFYVNDAGSSPREPWESTCGIFATVKSVKNVFSAEDEQPLSWSDFVLRYGSAHAAQAVVAESAAAYTEAPPLCELNGISDPIANASYTAHLPYPTQVFLACSLLSADNPPDAAKALEAINAHAERRAVQFGIAQAHLSAWKKRLECSGDAGREAFGSILAMLETLSNDKTLQLACLESIGLTEPQFALAKECGPDGFLYIASALQNEHPSKLQLFERSTDSAAEQDSPEQRKAIKELQTDKARLEFENQQLRDSYSYRIGHALLTVPRKAQALLNKAR